MCLSRIRWEICNQVRPHPIPGHRVSQLLIDHTDNVQARHPMRVRRVCRSGRVSSTARRAVNTPIKRSLSLPDQARPQRSMTALSNRRCTNNNTSAGNSSCYPRPHSAHVACPTPLCVPRRCGIRSPAAFAWMISFLVLVAQERINSSRSRMTSVIPLPPALTRRRSTIKRTSLTSSSPRTTSRSRLPARFVASSPTVGNVGRTSGRRVRWTSGRRTRYRPTATCSSRRRAQHSKTSCASSCIQRSP